MKRPETRNFAEFFKARRRALGVTLRSFCREHGLDPGNLSRMERGLLPPPVAREKLEQYASWLELRRGSGEWHEFLDLASAAAGRVPRDLLSDEEVARQLPVLFRTLRGQKVGKRQLDELIRLLRKG